MERLTNELCPIGCNIGKQIHDTSLYFGEEPIYKNSANAIEKLWFYENTGLEPNEVAKVLSEWKRLDGLDEYNDELLKENNKKHEQIVQLQERCKVLERALANAAKMLELKKNIDENYSAYHYYTVCIVLAEKELADEL